MPRLRTRWRLATRLAATVLLLAAAGCDDDPLSPFQPEIANLQDNFQFQVTALSNVTTTRDYTWINTGTTANVNQSTSLSAGSATLVIHDAANAEVYRRDLKQNGTFQTAAGTAGSWRIRVELTNASGAVNFRVQKP